MTSTSGTAVSIATATGDFVFHAINANGAGKGIVVSGATGTFTVNGTGTTDGTGGTVQNSTSRGAEFISSNNITLKNMTFTNNGVGGNDLNCGDALGASLNTSFVTSAACESNIHLQSVTTVVLNNVSANDGDAHGINGVAVDGLTLTNVDALRNGDMVGEDGVQLVNLTGTVNVAGGVFRDNASRSFEVQNNSGIADHHDRRRILRQHQLPDGGRDGAEPQQLDRERLGAAGHERHQQRVDHLDDAQLDVREGLQHRVLRRHGRQHVAERDLRPDRARATPSPPRARASPSSAPTAVA